MSSRLQSAVTRRRFFTGAALTCLGLLAFARRVSPAAQIIVNNPRPSVSSLSPSSVVAGSPSITLYITGNNFVDGAFVTFGGESLPPSSLNGAQITVSVPSSALVQAGSRIVSVTNPPPGGGTAQALMPFQVTAPPLPPQLN
jgi:IPT/TIG domain